MENTNTNNAAKVLEVLQVPTLNNMPEVVKTAANAEKQAAELVKTAAAELEKAKTDINAAISAGDITAAQKALKAQGKVTAELEKAKTAHKTAAAELEKAKTENPYKQPTAAEYTIVAAVEMLRNGVELKAADVAAAAVALMPEDKRPAKLNSPEVIARAVIAVLNCIKVQSK